MDNVRKSNSSNKVRIEMESVRPISGKKDFAEALKDLDDRNWENPEEFDHISDQQPFNIAHLAAFRGKLGILESAKARHPRLSLSVQDDRGRCALHYAAQKGHVEVLKWLLERLTNNQVPSGTGTSDQPQKLQKTPPSRPTNSKPWWTMSRSKFDRKDKEGRTPLHAAVYGGHLECIRILIKEGLSLASATIEGETVAQAIFKRIPNPVAFLTEIFDQQVTARHKSGNKVTLDFRVLTAPPARFPDEKSDTISDLHVVFALIHAVQNMEEPEILQHPLLNTFIHEKYFLTRCLNGIILFLYVVCFFFLFRLLIGTDPTDMQCWITIMDQAFLLAIGSTVIDLVPILSGTLIFGLCFLRKRLSTYTGMLSLILIVIFSPIMTVDFKQNNPSLMQHFIVIMILLLSINTMRILSRFPLLGEYIHMFYAVLLSIGKVLLSFTSLIIGCALSFMVLFSGSGQLSSPWKALAKILMIMAGEYNYDEFFPYDRQNSTNDNSTSAGAYNTSQPLTSTLFFVIFVMVTSVGLLNLIVGLAVSDIQDLLKVGRIRRLKMQAKSVLQWVWLAHVIHKVKGRPGWYGAKIANRTIELDLHTRRGIPTDLKKALRALAIKNLNRDKTPPTDSSDPGNKEPSLADIQASLERIEQRIQNSLMQ